MPIDSSGTLRYTYIINMKTNTNRNAIGQYSKVPMHPIARFNILASILVLVGFYTYLMVVESSSRRIALPSLILTAQAQTVVITPSTHSWEWITLSRVCEQDDECTRILWGMAMTESRMNANALGDGSLSLGFFQIHKGYHPDVTDSCRKSLECSAQWTLKRMRAYGFDESPRTGIRAHNGGLNNPKTLDYYNSVMQFAEQAN
jgi:hypothetical protein